MTTQTVDTNHQALARQALPELDVRKLKLAEATLQLAQLQLQRLLEHRDSLVRETLARYVDSPEEWGIDLQAGTLVRQGGTQ